jgi:hypothetical protein
MNMVRFNRTPTIMGSASNYPMLLIVNMYLICKITKSTFYRYQGRKPTTLEWWVVHRYIQEISIEYHIPILRDKSNHIVLSQKEIIDKIKKGA